MRLSVIKSAIFPAVSNGVSLSLLLLACILVAFSIRALALVIYSVEGEGQHALAMRSLAFTCHQEPDRCYWVGGRQLPLCARCIGLNFGVIGGLLIASIRGKHMAVSFHVWALLSLLAFGDIALKPFGLDAWAPWRTVAGVALGILLVALPILTAKCLWNRTEGLSNVRDR
jgi:uncharacterized membrane protein